VNAYKQHLLFLQLFQDIHLISPKASWPAVKRGQVSSTCPRVDSKAFATDSIP
jgi:hypothetical protein